jgi:hypothetical protein
MSATLTVGVGLGVADGLAAAAARSRRPDATQRDGHEQDDEHDAAGGEHAAGTAQSRHGSRPGRHALRLRTSPVGRR